MPTEGTDQLKLLGTDEPAPFEVLNPKSEKPLLLVCDHASRRIPLSLGGLGVDPAVRRCHLAWDIGAGELTRRLAESLGATAVLQQYSRLVVDCNRQLLDPGAFLEYGDGMVIDGNRNLNAETKQARADAIYWPYHQAVATEIKRLSRNGTDPSIVAIHSFTPVLNGASRACQIGILWDADERISAPLIRDLRNLDLIVGDNEPYSGKALQDFTIDHHAETAGLPHVGLEIRQDLLAFASGVSKMADVLHSQIERIQSQLHPRDIGSSHAKLPA